MTVTLVVTGGPSAGERIELSQELTLGREGTDVVVADPELSRRHLSLRPLPDGVEVRDLGSLNGTTIGGEKINESVTVHNGAEIRIGQTTIMIEIPEPDVGKTKLAGSLAPEGFDQTRIRARPEIQPTTMGKFTPPLGGPTEPQTPPGAPPPAGGPGGPPGVSPAPGPPAGGPPPGFKGPPRIALILLRLGKPGRAIAMRMARRKLKSMQAQGPPGPPAQ